MDTYVPALKRATQALGLRPISYQELSDLGDCPFPIFTYDGSSHLVEVAAIDWSKNIRKGAKHGHKIFYLREKDWENLVAFLQEKIIKAARGLSMAKPPENIIYLNSLLIFHMRVLYTDPLNDKNLQVQYQNSKTLGQYLYENDKLIPKLVSVHTKTAHQYLYKQPFLSSYFTLGLLKFHKIYGQDETLKLYLTSLFKDLGMAMIPAEKLNKKLTAKNEINLFRDHPHMSANLLSGRIDLSENHLNIIRHHHLYSQLTEGEEVISKNPNTLISGFETRIVSLLDVISALNTGRPYREGLNLFETLEKARLLIGESQFQEFRLIVNYFQKLFS